MKSRFHKYALLIFFVTFIGAETFSQVVAKLSVEPENYPRHNSPVSKDLRQIIKNDGKTRFSLFETTDETRRLVASHIEWENGVTLFWILDGETKPGKRRAFELAVGKNKPTQTLNVNHGDSALVLQSNGRNVLKYNFEEVAPPEGTDKIFTRGAFIHPLYSPSGKVLTRIFPSDHWHHMGIWNPWTLTEYKGKEVDFWNLIKGEGTIRYNSLVKVEENPVYTGFKSLHDHIAYFKGEEDIAMKETWEVKVWNPGNAENWWIVDFTSTLNTASDEPVLLKEYRYGGFGFRATADWETANTEYVTSHGKKGDEADATYARWCRVTGTSEGSSSGILFMSHPSNFNHPEPMRVWPSSSNDGKSNIFFSFSPTRDSDWNIEPGKNYSLTYRMLVFDGEFSEIESENFWKSFGNAPIISVQKIEK